MIGALFNDAVEAGGTGQLVPAVRPSRVFAGAVFVSFLIHVVLCYILWNTVINSEAVDSSGPENDTSLILSLSTFTADSNNRIAPETDSPAQNQQSSSESTTDENESEVKAVVISEEQDVSMSEIHEKKSPAAHVTPSFELEAANRMEWVFKSVQEFKPENFDTWKEQVIQHSETPEKKYSEAFSIPPFGIEAIFHNMKQNPGGTPDDAVENITIKTRKLYINTYIAQNSDPRENCKTAYSGWGLLAIPMLIKDAVTGKGCKWKPVLRMDKPQRYAVNSQVVDTHISLLPFDVEDNKVIFIITNKGEINVKGEKINLNAIKGIMEIFKDEYPEGRIKIVCDSYSHYNTALEIRDHARAAKVKMVIIVADK